MYKHQLKKSMELLSLDKKILFVGYGLKYGSCGGGILVDIPKNQIIETPVAENLMLSMSIGLSLEGFKPVVIFERMDFLMNAMDALVNHLDKIPTISRKEFMPEVMIRCIVGGRKNPFFTGITHIQDHTAGVSSMLTTMKCESLTNSESIKLAYNQHKNGIFVEYKDLYNENI